MPGEPEVAGRDGSAGPGRLEGRVALVTGASRGIGLATARRLTAEGASVVITARRQDDLDAALAALPDGSALGVAGSADDAEHRGRVIDLVAERHGRLDILANLVGANRHYGPLLELDPESARRVLELNVLTPLAWTRAVCDDERLSFRERGGSVVNLSSVTGDIPSEGIGFYGVSKAAVSQLSRTLAVELAPRVRVNAVAPAVIRTGFSKALYDGREEEVAGRYPLGRIGEPDDVAAMIAFLVSDDASWVTGQVVTLDGGLLTAGGRA